MSFIRFKSSISLGLLLASATVAHAAPISLTLDPTAQNTVGPQSASAPCIIAGTQCQNGSFPFNNFVSNGNISAYNEDSPTYEISDFPFLSFNVAIDVVSNSAHSETLQNFSVFVDADGAAGAGGFEEIYNFTGPAVIGITSSPGNGFADWILSSIDLSSYADDALVMFNAVWDEAVGGPESFFLVRTGAVTEPGTLMLLGLGLLAIGLSHRRPKRRDS